MRSPRSRGADSDRIYNSSEGVTWRLVPGEQNIDIADDTMIYRGEEARVTSRKAAGSAGNLHRSPGRVEGAEGDRLERTPCGVVVETGRLGLTKVP